MFAWSGGGRFGSVERANAAAPLPLLLRAWRFAATAAAARANAHPQARKCATVEVSPAMSTRYHHSHSHELAAVGVEEALEARLDIGIGCDRLPQAEAQLLVFQAVEQLRLHSCSVVLSTSVTGMSSLVSAREVPAMRHVARPIAFFVCVDAAALLAPVCAAAARTRLAGARALPLPVSPTSSHRVACKGFLKVCTSLYTHITLLAVVKA